MEIDRATDGDGAAATAGFQMNQIFQANTHGSPNGYAALFGLSKKVL
jgi:hypothetical protein